MRLNSSYFFRTVVIIATIAIIDITIVIATMDAVDTNGIAMAAFVVIFDSVMF